MAGDFLTYGAAKLVLDSMTRNGLLNEAVYFAGKALSAGARQRVIDRLSKTAAEELAPYLGLIAKNWESFRDEDIPTTGSARNAWVRLACHVPELVNDKRFSHFFAYPLSSLVSPPVAAKALLDLSRDLVRQGEGEKAAATLVTAARPEFSSVSVLETANKLALELPARKPTGSDQNLAKRLKQASTSMAMLNQHGLAFQTELIAKRAQVDVEQYRAIGYRMLELAPAALGQTPTDHNRQGSEIELGSKL